MFRTTYKLFDLRAKWLFLFILVLAFSACKEKQEKSEKAVVLNISPDNEGITVPDGFGVIKVADSLGKPRHIAVNSNGGVYLKLRKPIDGEGIIYLEDRDGDGIADAKKGFADYGGTGMYLDKNYLYASSDEEIFRYKLDASGEVTDTNAPDTLVTNLVSRGTHATKSFTMDGEGNIYVNIGAYSNACQEVDRTLGSPGMMPCSILDSAGGIWQFRADKMKQSYSEGKRYATGLRNVVGLDWNYKLNKLVVTQHGRDQLKTLYPDLYDLETSANLPAETMYIINEGDDAGWPYIYYDQFQNKKILSPEYGGDGNKTAGENAIDPLATFPAHMAPNALLFYTGELFPEEYKNGAFIAFHGSWNRAPQKQKGFMVAFVPFKNGKPSGEWQIFADGFAGLEEVSSPSEAAYRPTGLAQGPDGSLYVSDDAGGALFRIVYHRK